jgi:hypothetical protein
LVESWESAGSSDLPILIVLRDCVVQVVSHVEVVINESKAIPKGPVDVREGSRRSDLIPILIVFRDRVVFDLET